MKRRRVCSLPENKLFGPQSTATVAHDQIRMSLDEYETIRLIDLEAFTQEECADQMEVGRTTVQAIYASARQKLADALVNGKLLTIDGGSYQLCDDTDKGCGRACRRHGQGRGSGRRSGQGRGAGQGRGHRNRP